MLYITECAVYRNVSESKIDYIPALVKILLNSVSSFSMPYLKHVAILRHRHVYRKKLFFSQFRYSSRSDLISSSIPGHLAGHSYDIVLSYQRTCFQRHKPGVSGSDADSVCYAFSVSHTITFRSSFSPAAEAVFNIAYSPPMLYNAAGISCSSSYCIESVLPFIGRRRVLHRRRCGRWTSTSAGCSRR